MTPNFILAYVSNPQKSAELYGKLLGLTPVESSPGWAMFAMPNGVNLGLWSNKRGPAGRDRAGRCRDRLPGPETTTRSAPPPRTGRRSA